MQVTIQEINATIIAGNFTNDQLDSISMAIKFARSQIARMNKSSMMCGDKVRFVSSKTGKYIVGNVMKVNRKYIVVREQRTNGTAMNWRVPANMLQATE